ncbi:MAG: extracellular solute-binding protein [Oscillospiraceae bacterium]|nr:extracellular solute-binding protein [Oscillospiraceae bacterium]
MRKIAAFVLTAAVFLSAISVDFSVRARESGEDVELRPSINTFASDSSYENYLVANSNANHTSDSISISIDSFTASGNADCKISKAADSLGMLSWQGTGSVSWDFEAREAGLYCLEMSYFSQSGNNSVVSFGIEIDGEYPFDEAREIKFYRYWKNKTSIRLDTNHKNQLLPELVKYDCNMISMARSSESSDDPLWFYLSRGKHKLTLNGVSTDFFIGSLKFCENSGIASYDSIRPTSEQLSETPALIDKTAILVEAEMPKYTNSAVLRPTSEPSDSSVSPSHPTYVRYNTIGADSWDTAGQTLFYEVSVPSDGYYALNIKYRTNSGAGLPSYRRIRVNGAILCEELNAAELPYSADWRAFSPTDEDGETIYFNLKTGKNIISLEAINGKTGTALRYLDGVVSDIINRADSGEISGRFGYYAEEILSAKSALEDAAGGKINASEIDVLANLLKRYEENEPNDISALKRSLNSVCGWIENNRRSSVEMDYLELKTVHEEFRTVSRDFFKQLIFIWERFWGSFFKDAAASDSGEATTLSAVSDSDSANIINSLSNNYPDTIRVTGKTGSLIEMALSGNAPDMALFVDEDEVYELASRGLIVNLAALGDYETVEKRSPVGVSKLYEYDGGIYGIPLTNSFPMMFCRDDVLNELGLGVPESWDELKKALAVLNEHGLTAGLGSESDGSADSVFMMMLSQSGQETENGFVPDLGEAYVSDAFSSYTELYTKYGCPREYDALRLFKTGRMPIVIADYSAFYGELSDISELRGLWSISHIPGTNRTDKSGKAVLDYSTYTNSLGAVIFADSRNISDAWEFIKWFSQSDTQTLFGVMKEASSSEIYAPSNLTALSNLRQSAAEYRRLSAQASRINETPKAPMLAVFRREAYLAFLEVASGKSSPWDAALKYSRK